MPESFSGHSDLGWDSVMVFCGLFELLILPL